MFQSIEILIGFVCFFSGVQQNGSKFLLASFVPIEMFHFLFRSRFNQVSVNLLIFPRALVKEVKVFSFNGQLCRRASAMVE